MKTDKKLIATGLFTAITASLCCLTPVLAFVAGTGGLATTFSWLAPFRPYFVGLTILALGLAWYQKLRSHKEINCNCEKNEKLKFLQSKRFLGLVTGFAITMLAFPYYAPYFYPGVNHQTLSMVYAQGATRKITINIKGMTCTGCEGHLENVVARLQGVKTVKASYESSSITVGFLPDKTREEQIMQAIHRAGYEVVEENPGPRVIIDDPGNVSFYKVPLVCNAAPAIGCGSRSKSVLLALEKSDNVAEAWLNRRGTVIALVWKPGTEFQTRRNVVTEVFTTHQVNASELLSNDYTENLASFSAKEGWYKGTDVNKLSKEEAEILADRFLQAIKEKTTLTSTQEQKLKKRITNSFYDFFLNFKSMDELVDPQSYKVILTDIIEFGNDLLGNNKMPELNELWSVCAGDVKSCDHKECSTTCKFSTN